MWKTGSFLAKPRVADLDSNLRTEAKTNQSAELVLIAALMRSASASRSIAGWLR